ncbi:hypothetical protein, partial [Planktotalea frisia]|uniref:hypothetical protein n=1 Tax=Planktotalea frisia TaxID=696762 RepID=UPI001C3163EF
TLHLTLRTASRKIWVPFFAFSPCSSHLACCSTQSHAEGYFGAFSRFEIKFIPRQDKRNAALQHTRKALHSFKKFNLAYESIQIGYAMVFL